MEIIIWYISIEILSVYLISTSYTTVRYSFRNSLLNIESLKTSNMGNSFWLSTVWRSYSTKNVNPKIVMYVLLNSGATKKKENAALKLHLDLWMQCKNQFLKLILHFARFTLLKFMPEFVMLAPSRATINVFCYT